MLNTAATGHHEQSNKSCSLPLEAKTHLSQNPTPPMKFQNPTCQPQAEGLDVPPSRLRFQHEQQGGSDEAAGPQHLLIASSPDEIAGYRVGAPLNPSSL